MSRNNAKTYIDPNELDRHLSDNINPQQLLIDTLDHIHDGNREELIGQLILMLGWLHKGGEMPYVHKDSDTVWVVPTEE